MDATPTPSQPQQPSAANPPSTGPQIRSRITVVCAECKRLKLKCDRRAPCGSCTKRGTVERCIYSPAAAEKVDLHSLNNRLIQVEATLALVTSGQNPPAFQSTYPLAQLANTSSSSQNQGSHQHHHHYAAPTLRNACISLSHQDLSLWFDELDLGISLPSSSSSGASSSHQHNVPLAGPSGYIKLEPEIELAHPCSITVNSIGIDADDSQWLSGNTPKPYLTSPTSSPLNPHAYLRNPAHQQFQSPSQLQKQQRYSAQLSLPALSIYYPVSSITLPGTSPLSASAFPHHPASSSTIRTSTSPPTPTRPPSVSASSSPYTFPAHSQPPQYSKPQITSALVALLPPLPTCKRFLNCAKEIFHLRPVPFEPGNGWVGFEKRCLSLLGGGNLGKKERERDKAKEREERAREAKRARQIYFAGIPDLQSVQQRNDNLEDSSSGGGISNSGFGGSRILNEGGMAGDEFSLAFFAVLCAVLAVGCHSSSSSQGSSSSENPAFFFALSQQALGVWDTHTSSSGIAEERERMDFLLASLIGVVYLMLSGSSVSAVGEDEDQKGINLAYPLVGKIVNAARGMGLGRDSSGQQLKTSDDDASASSCRLRGGYQTNKEKETEREKLWEEWKLLMWWDITFYDLFIADSLGHQPYISSHAFTTKLPECASDRALPTLQADPDNDALDTEDEELEYSHRHDGMAMQQDDLDKNRHLPTVNNGINGITEGDEEAYFAARCRLTQLAQTIKHRMAYPECCCGYTLDQAAFLESEIRRWQWALAPSIKRSSVSSGENALRHPPLPCGGDPSGHQDKPAVSLISQIQSCELSLMASLLMLRVHAPFWRAPSPAPTPLSQRTKVGSSVSPLNAHAAESSIKAAQSIIRTARSLHAALGSHMSSSISPSMLDFYSLEKMVLDSVIICANPGLFTKLFPSSSTWMFDTNALMEDVASGLNLLSELRVMTEPHRNIVDALSRKLSQRGTNLLKRKHDQVDMTFENLSSPGVGDGTMSGFDGSHNGNSVIQQSKVIDLSSAFPSPVSSVPMSSAGPEQQQQQHVQKHKKSDSGDLMTAITNAASARLTAAAAERDNEKGKEKERDKNVKNAKKSYPSVGIRVRVAKDGSIIRPQRVQATTTGGQMQAPPPRLNPDVVLAFQQQQKQKLQATTPTQVAHTVTGSQHSQTSSQASSPPSNTMNMIHEDRSRSLQTEDVNPQSMNLPLPFVSSPEQMDIQTMSPKDYGIHDTNSQRQQHQSFGSGHMFDPQSQALYEQSQSSFDPITSSSGGSADGMSYNQVSSSPFSNGSGAVSASSSPFTATSSGHPPTPTFPSHHSTPPLFGPAPPPPSTTSPATYYRGSSSFTSYAANSPTLQSSNLATLQQHGNGSGMPLMDIGMDSTMMPPPILETPIYDKSQHPMYDPKPSVVDDMSRHHHHHHHNHHHQQHFQQHHHHPSYDDGSQNHRHMVSVIPPWSSPPPPQHQQQHQQSLMSAQNGQSFWSNGEGFKFYS